MINGLKAMLLFFGGSMLALAAGGEYQSFRDFAPVLKVEPITETWSEPVTRKICPDPGIATGEFAPLASTIGDDIRQQTRLWQARDVCKAVTEKRYRRRITGYWVTYRYGGRTSRTQLSYDPGKRVPVDVRLSPLP